MAFSDCENKANGQTYKHTVCFFESVHDLNDVVVFKLLSNQFVGIAAAVVAVDGVVAAVIAVVATVVISSTSTSVENF